jgi:hypothetical protein
MRKLHNAGSAKECGTSDGITLRSGWNYAVQNPGLKSTSGAAECGMGKTRGNVQRIGRIERMAGLNIVLLHKPGYRRDARV